MTDKQMIEILKKRHPDVYAKIKATDVGSINNTLVDLAWFFSCMYEQRTNIFICACLLKYSPNTIVDNSRVTHGLVGEMARVKGVTKGAISQKITTAVFQYQHYADIEEKANRILDKLNNVIYE
ncbi:hypothetical protein [Sphingobacterium multivorum]|uniref:hypothetical protein n=1 Tax=Sphingobacterium multivorum TaxID=28454 RepID=UPI002FDA7FC7